MVVNITTIHFHYHVVTIHGSDVHFNSGDVHYSVFTVYVQETGRAGKDSLPSLATLVKKQPVEDLWKSL